MMLKINNPSIRYCCKNVINFSIRMDEKLVFIKEYENGRIFAFNGRIDVL